MVCNAMRTQANARVKCLNANWESEGEKEKRQTRVPWIKKVGCSRCDPCRCERHPIRGREQREQQTRRAEPKPPMQARSAWKQQKKTLTRK